MIKDQCCDKPQFDKVNLGDKPPFLYCKNCEGEWKIHWEEQYTVPIEDIEELK